MKRSRCVSGICGMVMAGALFMSTGLFVFAGNDSYRGVDTEEKIYDYAELLTRDEEELIGEECHRLQDAYGYDVFVVTIDDNNIVYNSSDRSLSFLEDFGDENGFGVGAEKNYVSFLIDMDERQYSLDVKGDTCFLIYSDEVQSQILDDVYEPMAEGEYAEAIWTFLQEVDARGVNEVSQFVGSEEEYQAYLQRHKWKEFWVSLAVGFVFSVGIGSVCGGVIVLAKKRQSQNVHLAQNATGYMEQGSYHLTEQSDRLIRRYQTVRHIETSSGSHSGGSSHHTTTHHSSGGSRHSGGSRRF